MNQDACVLLAEPLDGPVGFRDRVTWVGNQLVQQLDVQVLNAVSLEIVRDPARARCQVHNSADLQRI
eukprot:CAMPEP_0176297418 /NCGR_PEP_ID=MMETSP0121_2-20121125/58712_1 /TAXON_ID=160619 /ORGANISM="Kryptoperidinium foliaceum, Strain CCMP 1326" /LENGTH=66 /DNA_ID=CAMNT_0017638607 /DNA_START=151 /DNA_END=351 /DNA_ORIENTATION=-